MIKDREVDLVFALGEMVPDTKVNGLTTHDMETESTSALKVSMLVSGSMT